ncbi:MAG: GPR endopeptidase [Clostridia bacterium]|nr:GPR endopeptidase [Clostridia bacterium]
MKRFIRTDLACERQGGIDRCEYTLHGCRVCEMSEYRGHERVCYSAVHIGALTQMDERECGRATRAVTALLEQTATRLVQKPACVLVACLGNPRITPDSLGPCTAHSLAVTRHVQLLDAAAFARFGKGSLCLVAPGVLGDTGVESAELVRATVREVRADLVIAVDALAASSCPHLGAVVQICDHGLRPGAGLGNRRVAIDRDGVGCPVISLGIPTVIDSAAMICEALAQAGICGVGKSLEAHLSRAKRYFVAPGDIDALVERGGKLLARAIGTCFGVE